MESDDSSETKPQRITTKADLNMILEDIERTATDTSKTSRRQLLESIRGCEDDLIFRCILIIQVSN